MKNIKLQIKDDFLKDENRDGYFVPSDMKAVWAVELDLLAEFQRICKKYNLKFFADGGTLLGTIRHKGFIPWDDDIDVVMMRDQYEIFCNIAKDEVKEPYFFQTEETDPSSLRGHAQLRNSLTTGIINSELQGVHNYNQGIFIDIFPLDSVPEDEGEFERKIQAVGYNLSKARMLANITDRYTPTFRQRPFRSIIKRIAYILFSKPLRKTINYDTYYEKYEEECKSGNNKDTLKVAKYFCIPFHRGQVWYREDFSDSIMMPFEMLEMPVPIGYKRILDTFFGEDWMTPKRIPTYHSGVIFDVEVSYLEYKKGRQQ